LHDLAAALTAWAGAYWLRFNFDIPAVFMEAMINSMAIVVIVQGGVFHAFGLYRSIWRFVGLRDLKRILMAAGTAILTVSAVLFMTQRLELIPRSVLLLDFILLVLFIGGARFTYRAWKDGHFISRNEGKPVIVIGAGEAAIALLRELGQGSEWRVVGMLDDNPALQGRLINGVSIFGPLEEVGKLSSQMGVSHAIVAMPSASVTERRRAAELAAAAGMTVLTVPAYEDILSGRVAISRVRKIELEDLLGRDPVMLDEAGLQHLLNGRVVMVTGAGGSIGAELTRQIARFMPRMLIMIELSEYVLYAIQQDFSVRWPNLPIVCVLCDVKDEKRIEELFREYRPELVFHAAAYKHVPLIEQDNAWEGLRNNVLGTIRVAQAARHYGAKKFILISTDKAVNPSNVMGASKRLAEMVCQALQAESRDTHFVTVRFGNVLGSSGSVIPRFREQIARGGPVTVTHPDIIRYFMLIPEAAQLVLQAGLMGQGGEIFVLDMGEPVKIVDLARDMIRLSGYTEEEIRIVFTGLRPGEKLYEELLADGEHTLPTPHPKLRIARAQASLSAAALAELLAWLQGPPQDEMSVKRRLAELVPEYRPQEKGGMKAALLQ
jgi:FlaA1/EpsC-like NDP-sugar epimerase